MAIERQAAAIFKMQFCQLQFRHGVKGNCIFKMNAITTFVNYNFREEKARKTNAKTLVDRMSIEIARLSRGAMVLHWAGWGLALVMLLHTHEAAGSGEVTELGMDLLAGCIAHLYSKASDSVYWQKPV